MAQRCCDRWFPSSVAVGPVRQAPAAQQHCNVRTEATIQHTERNASGGCSVKAAAVQQFSLAAEPLQRSAFTAAEQSSLQPAALSPTQPPAISGQDPRAVTAAYVHLPFCKRKCFYCDFPVVAVGTAGVNAPAAADRFSDYVALLTREIVATSRVGPPAELQTVFFGGGTPSLIPPGLLADVLAALRRGFGIADNAEISMEADPGTFDAERLREYMALGVNRFSVGVQAFQQPLLEACGRSHSLEDARAALNAVRATAPRSWSLDLISGLPGLTRDAWRESLAAAIAAMPPHISIYDLQVEDGTPFGRWYPPGHAALLDDEQGAAMYRDASEVLREAGYEHYEVSNYALPGHRCRHNEVYWRNEPYHAFGLGAASYLDHRRFSRPRQMAAYRDWVGRFAEQGDRLPGRLQEPQPSADQLLDTVMLSLRTADGLDLAAVAEQHGTAAAARILASLEPRLSWGLVSVVEQQKQSLAGSLESADRKTSQHIVTSSACNPQRPGSWKHIPRADGQGGDDRITDWPCLRLTDPDGFLVSNDIISDVFVALT